MRRLRPPDPYDLIARLARLVAGDSLVGDIRLVAVLVSLGTVSVVLVPPQGPAFRRCSPWWSRLRVAPLSRRRPLLSVAFARPFRRHPRLRGAVLPAVAGPGLLLAAAADHARARARRRLISLAAFGAAIGVEMLSELDLPGSRGNMQALVSSATLSSPRYVGTEPRRRRETARRCKRRWRSPTASPTRRSAPGWPATCTARSATRST